ncbi:MAG: hypothetical protein JST94_11870 [Bacteroidetes bacterium]|nr:hypothetical protein [Bacteroidota bacterium]MBS1672123.1 hypothetical protein [Bacteroidota bacterium]
MFIGKPTDSISAVVSKIETTLHCKFTDKVKNNNGYAFEDRKGNAVQITAEDEIEKVIVSCVDAKSRLLFYNVMKQSASGCPVYTLTEKPFESISFNKGSRLYLKGMNIYILK